MKSAMVFEMTILIGVSEEFLNWLDECPVIWRLIKQDDDTLTYEFDKEVEQDE